MPDGFYKDLIKEISSLGFDFHAAAKGSHEKWKLRVTGKMLLMPFNLMSRHLANAILKDAGSLRKF